MAKKSSKKANKPSSLAVKKLPSFTKKISLRRAQQVLVGLAIILFIFSGWLWYKNILMNPQRAMDDMLASSLQTTSVTKVVKQEGGQNQSKQSVRLSFESGPMARTISEISQQGSGGNNVVVTETIGTKTTDYVRYTKIDIAQKPSGLDKVLNVWASQTSNDKNTVKPTFLNESGISIVPFGNLKQSDLQKITKQTKDKGVYKYTSVKTKWQHGRPTLVYEVSIKPTDLISILKTYSEVSGIGDVQQLNPDDYKFASQLQLEISIDVLSRQLISVNYPSSGRNETYSGYGVKNYTKLPTQTISIQELQSRAQKVGQ